MSLYSGCCWLCHLIFPCFFPVSPCPSVGTAVTVTESRVILLHPETLFDGSRGPLLPSSSSVWLLSQWFVLFSRPCLRFKENWAIRPPSCGWPFGVCRHWIFLGSWIVFHTNGPAQFHDRSYRFYQYLSTNMIYSGDTQAGISGVLATLMWYQCAL